jgi:hypothetical protein
LDAAGAKAVAAEVMVADTDVAEDTGAVEVTLADTAVGIGAVMVAGGGMVAAAGMVAGMVPGGDGAMAAHVFRLAA